MKYLKTQQQIIVVNVKPLTLHWYWDYLFFGHIRQKSESDKVFHLWGAFHTHERLFTYVYCFPLWSPFVLGLGLEVKIFHCREMLLTYWHKFPIVKLKAPDQIKRLKFHCKYHLCFGELSIYIQNNLFQILHLDYHSPDKIVLNHKSLVDKIQNNLWEDCHLLPLSMCKKQLGLWNKKIIFAKKYLNNFLPNSNKLDFFLI